MVDGAIHTYLLRALVTLTELVSFWTTQRKLKLCYHVVMGFFSLTHFQAFQVTQRASTKAWWCNGARRLTLTQIFTRIQISNAFQTKFPPKTVRQWIEREGE